LYGKKKKSTPGSEIDPRSPTPILDIATCER
jgi:hypothetical protein